MYYIYMLLCKGDSLYTGIAADIDKRMSEHFSGTPQCAKYTRSHPPERLLAVWSCENRSDALRLEYRIKQLERRQKLELVNGAPLSFMAETSSLYTAMDLKNYERWTGN